LGSVRFHNVRFWLIADKEVAMDDFAKPLVLDEIVRGKRRAEITGLKKSRWYEMERAGLTPKRRRIGTRAVGWSLRELLEWVASRPAP
jgi:prophage regulatory protein